MVGGGKGRSLLLVGEEFDSNGSFSKVIINCKSLSGSGLCFEVFYLSNLLCISLENSSRGVGQLRCLA